jgi:MtrB/PioB family decaheme-associated outer membrane protein
MRIRSIILTTALLLCARAGAAQTTPPAQGQAPAPEPAATPSLRGTVDIGGLFTGTDGDQARFERYRDARDGVYSSFSLTRESDSYLFDANASHVGYRDQRYNTEFLARRINFGVEWVSVPLNFSYLTRTPYVTNGSTLTLDAAARRAVEGPTNAASDGSGVGVPCAPGAPPAACGNPAQASQAKANRSIYNDLATPFDLRHRRDIAAFSLRYRPARAVDVDARFTSTKREGQQPWGASFAFNNAVELPKPLDERTNDLSLGTTWANSRATFRLGWDGSWFNNHLQSMVWDNPIRVSDFNNGLLPPNGPYDPSGYSNGNGPAQGREALAPGNTMNVLSATALYKLQRRTTLNGTLQLSSQNQNAPLIPWTINPLINSPVVVAAFPHLAQLPRATAEAEAKGVNALLSLSSRPYRRVNFAVRYRFNKRDVRTPLFDATEYVRFDAVPEENEEGFSPQFDTSRHIFDANVAFTPSTWGTVRLGYGHEAVDRRGRGFSNVGENILRLSYDVFSNRFMSIRASFDAARRRGEGFVEAESGNDDLEPLVGPGGTQPTLRYYDEADRDRTRGSVVFTVMPLDVLDVYVQFGGGKDKYMPDDSVPVSRPGELFGLQESSVTSWNVGFNLRPTDVITFGANYAHDTYGSFQRSRNANPPPDPSWTDPSRDWTLDNDDKTNNVNLYLDLLRALRNTDIRFGYDFSNSDNSFVHGGPRIAALASINQFIPLPDVTNAWHRVTADVQYFFTARAGVGVGYYLEKLEVVDFNTVDTNGPVGFAPATGQPRIDWLGGLITGYGNRPYTGSSGYLRLLYRF